MEENDKLVIRDFPGTTLWLGLGLMLFALIIFNVSRDNLIISLILAVVGLVVLAFSKVLFITVDKKTRILRLRYQGLLWASVKNIPFDHLQTIHVDRSTSMGKESNNSAGVSYSYCIEAVLKNGDKIPFRAYYTSGFLEQQNQVQQLCTFIGLPMEKISAE